MYVCVCERESDNSVRLDMHILCAITIKQHLASFREEGGGGGGGEVFPFSN